MGIQDTGGVAGADGTGRAEQRIGPVPPGYVWHISRLVVSVAGGYAAHPNAEATIYRDTEQAVNKIDHTNRGADDVATDTRITLRTGSSLLCVWSGINTAAASTQASFSATVQAVPA